MSPLNSQGLTPFSRALHSPSYFFPQSQSHLWMCTQSASPAAGWCVRDSQSSDSTLHPRKLRFGEMRSLSKGQTSSECLMPAPIVFLLVHLHPSWHAGPSCVGQEDSHILGVVLGVSCPLHSYEFFLQSSFTYHDSWKFPEVLVIPVIMTFSRDFSIFLYQCGERKHF